MEDGVGSSSDKEVLLLCKEIEIEKKDFCFEFKETFESQVQYIIISQNGSSILLPSLGISCFLDTVDGLFSLFEKKQQKGFSKEREKKIISDKEFCFEIGRNKLGHFLKVKESSENKSKSTILIPSGSKDNNGWELFRKTLAEIYKNSRSFFPPLQKECAPAECHTELSDAKVESVTSPSAQNCSVEQLNKEPSQSKRVSSRGSKMMRAGSKTFYFDLGSNKRGHFLKISEVMSGYRSSIFIPLPDVQQFHETLGCLLESANQSLTSSSLKQEFRELKVVEAHSGTGN